MKQKMDILIVEPGKAPRPAAGQHAGSSGGGIGGHGTGGVFPAAEGAAAQPGGYGRSCPEPLYAGRERVCKRNIPVVRHTGGRVPF